MKKGLFIAMMLCLTATAQAEQVVVETKNNSLVLGWRKGNSPSMCTMARS
jgi:hypothetical protein